MTDGGRQSGKHQFAFFCSLLEAGWVKDRTLAIDGGAHVGRWSARLAQDFQRVIAFEPVPETFAILAENMRAHPTVECYPSALMDCVGTVKIMAPPKKEKTLSRYVKPSRRGPIAAVTIDTMRLPSCGLIKLDLEGAEYRALRGAEETVRRCRPLLVIEVDKYGKRFGNRARHLLGLIDALGYRQVAECGPDRAFVHRDCLP